MIALRVLGEGRSWTAEVVAVSTGESDEWTKVEKPARVRAKRPDLAVLRAITAHVKAQRPLLVCERCGHRWHLSKRMEAAGKDPLRCPKCKNLRRRKARRRDWNRGRPSSRHDPPPPGPAPADDPAPATGGTSSE